MTERNTFSKITNKIFTSVKNIVSTRWFLVVLILILMWRILKQNFILLVIIAYLLFKAYQESKRTYVVQEQNQTVQSSENFDADGLEFLPVGEQRYDLRGIPLFNRPLYDCWNTEYGDCYNSNF